MGTLRVCLLVGMENSLRVSTALFLHQGRACKVAGSKQCQGLEELSGGNIWRYKYFDVALNDGTGEAL